MVIIAGARPLHLAGLFAAVAGAAAPLAIYALAHDYQKERISILARSGQGSARRRASTSCRRRSASAPAGLLGQGVHARHADAARLPAHADDRLRLQRRRRGAGVRRRDGAVRAVRRSLLFRCLRVAGLADDAFGRLIAVGVMSFILFQVFVNIGVNIRLVPVTGVPLPLVSQGGSSLITILASLGILQSILGHRRKRGRRDLTSTGAASLRGRALRRSSASASRWRSSPASSQALARRPRRHAPRRRPVAAARRLGADVRRAGAGGRQVARAAARARRATRRCRSVVRAYCIGNLLSNVLPTAVGGDVYRVYRMQREADARAADVTMSVLYERATGYGAMTCLGALGAAFYYGRRRDRRCWRWRRAPPRRWCSRSCCRACRFRRCGTTTSCATCWRIGAS